MSRPDDLNLLFGVLALQLNFVTRDQLVAAMHVWVLEKDKPLGEILARQGAIAENCRPLLEALLQKHLAQHGGDPQQCLAAVSSVGLVRDDLERLADPEINACLAAVAADPHPTPEPADPFATLAGEAETAAGRYRVLRPHAQGALGQVSVALDGELNREIALKEIRPEYSGSADSRGRFLREAEVTAKLEHPGIVPVYGLGTYADGRPYYAMRFIRGKSLKEALDRFHSAAGKKLSASKRNLAQRKLFGRFVDICNAVAYAHSRGVLHRDLKPGNIMLGKYGETLVVDWGLAKVVGRKETTGGEEAEDATLPLSGGEEAEDATLPLSGGGSEATPTRAGSSSGTPGYMSPEQAAGKVDELGPATDVYGLGAILYHVLCGRPPVTGNTVFEMLAKCHRGQIDPPRSVESAVPAALEAVCLKALALKPADRYADAKELAAEVERYLADEPVAALPETTWEKTGRWMRRHRGLVRSAAAGLLAVTTVSLVAAVIVADYAGKEAASRRQSDRLAEQNGQLATQESAARAKAELEEAKARQLAVDKTLLAEQEQAARTLAEKTAISLRSEVARNHFATGLAEYDAGRFQNGLLRLGNAWRIYPTNDLLRAGFAKVLVDRADQLDRPLREMWHQNDVRAVAFSPDGTRMLTGSGDDIARLWDAVSGVPLGEPLRHGSTVTATAFSPDGTRLLTGSLDKTARLWDAASGTSLGKPIEHEDTVHAVAFSPDGRRILTSCKSIAQLWDEASGDPVGEPLQHEDSVYAVAFSPDGMWILTGCDDSTARLWDAGNGAPLGEPLPHATAVRAVAFSPDGTRILTGRIDGMAQLWNAATGTPLGDPLQNFGSINAVAFGPDCKQVLIGSEMGARLWDAASGTLLRQPLWDKSSVRAVAFNPDGTTFLTGSDDGAARLWDNANDAPPGQSLRHEDWIRAAAFSPDGTQVLTGSDDGYDDGTARLWDAASGDPIGKPMQHEARVTAVAFSPDGTRILTGGGDIARLWDARSGASLGEPLRHEDTVNAVAFSPDGTQILTGCGDRAARLWNAASGAPLKEPLQHTGSVGAVAFSPDGTRILTGDWDGNARLWDAASGLTLGEPLRHGIFVLAVAFSPDGSRILTGSHDKTARLWDVASGAPLGEPLRHEEPVWAAVFSSDGTRILTGSDDHTARLWDAASFAPLGEPLRHEDSVRAVAFSPDGTRVLTGSDDKTARLWNVPRFYTPADPVAELAYLELLTDVNLPSDPAETTQPLNEAARAERREILQQRAGNWLADQQQRRDERVERWRRYQAAEAERAENWFAAEFHLRHLLESDGLPDREELRRRHERVTTELRRVRESSDTEVERRRPPVEAPLSLTAFPSQNPR